MRCSPPACWLLLAACLRVNAATAEAAELAEPPHPPPVVASPARLPEEFRLILAAEGHRLNARVLDAYVACRRREAESALAALGKSLPAAFLDWVDSDPEVVATVYASDNPAHVLLMLRSLALDVGEPRWKRYKSWLLAAAVHHANQGPAADITPREPLRLVVPGDPRRPVDTRDPSRPRDQQDAIVNFLEDNRIVASDVMYEEAWQAKFNESMASQGFPARVSCSMRLGPGPDKLKRQRLAKVMAAYRLFQDAYEAKGRIPREKDPRVSLPQWVVFQVDNHEAGKSRSGFPLDRAPWPVLTALLEPRLSLREAHHINAPGGDIIPPDRRRLNAYNTEMLKAVDVRPFPFAEGSWFMIKKHGGACGTRAMLAANQNKAQGLPSVAVSEIGHASWAEFAHFERTGQFRLRFQGGGHDPDLLTLQLGLPMGRGRDAEKASNWADFLQAIQGPGGVASYMRSLMGLRLIEGLSPEERERHGARMRQDALRINEGNLMINGGFARNAAEARADRRKQRRSRR